MSENYIESNQIHVFPCSNRINYPYDRLLTEYNLVSMINRLVDKKSFVVTTHIPDNQVLNGDPFMFNINGYLFTTSIGKIKDLSISLLENQDSVTIYGCIKVSTTTSGYGQNQTLETVVSEVLVEHDDDVENTSNGETSTLVSNSSVSYNSTELQPMDSDSLDSTQGKFTGVKFSTSTLADHVCLALVQITKSSSNAYNYSVPEESKVKFQTISDGSFRSVVIDDGEL